MHLTYRHRDRPIVLDVNRTGDARFSVTVDGHTAHEVRAQMLDPSTLHLVIDGQARTIRLVRIGQSYHVAIDGSVYVLTREAGVTAAGAGVLAAPQIFAPMPGKVLKVLVDEGQEVQAGDGLLILEAMKMENRIVAEAPAVVRKLHVSEGQMVDGGEVMVELEYQTATS